MLHTDTPLLTLSTDTSPLILPHWHISILVFSRWHFPTGIPDCHWLLLSSRLTSKLQHPEEFKEVIKFSGFAYLERFYCLSGGFNGMIRLVKDAIVFPGRKGAGVKLSRPGRKVKQTGSEGLRRPRPGAKQAGSVRLSRSGAGN